MCVACYLCIIFYISSLVLSFHLFFDPLGFVTCRSIKHYLSMNRSFFLSIYMYIFIYQILLTIQRYSFSLLKKFGTNLKDTMITISGSGF